MRKNDDGTINFSPSDLIVHMGSPFASWMARLSIDHPEQLKGVGEALEIAAGYNKSNKTNLTTTLSGDGKQYGIQYSKFVPILVKAIQEQQTLIESLTARITTLEG